jgi:hypothetical protein
MTRARAAAALVLVAACGAEADPRFSTPESTISTMMAAYGIDAMSEEEIQRHMREHRRFDLRDEAAFRACFSDYAGPADEGAAGFVFGMIAAKKDSLRIDVDEGTRAVIYPDRDRVDRMVTLLREDDGEWKISLERSVPADVRRTLRQVYDRARTQNQQQGAPQ